MNDLDRFLQEQLKNPCFRFWWYFYQPYYIYRTIATTTRNIHACWQCCRRKRKAAGCRYGDVAVTEEAYATLGCKIGASDLGGKNDVLYF